MNQLQKSYFVTRFPKTMKTYLLHTTVSVQKKLKALYSESGFQTNTTTTQKLQQLIINMQNCPSRPMSGGTLYF